MKAPVDKFGRCLDCHLKDWHGEGCRYWEAAKKLADTQSQRQPAPEYDDDIPFAP